jgi:hypothetical protein
MFFVITQVDARLHAQHSPRHMLNDGDPQHALKGIIWKTNSKNMDPRSLDLLKIKKRHGYHETNENSLILR